MVSFLYGIGSALCPVVELQLQAWALLILSLVTTLLCCPREVRRWGAECVRYVPQSIQCNKLCSVLL